MKPVTSGTLVNTGSIITQYGSGGVGGRTITADIDNRGTMTLSFGLTVAGQLIVPNTASATVCGGGNTMTVRGLDVDGLTVDNVPLISTNGTITRFDNLTFQNMSATASQLTINHPGAAAALTFNSTTFLTTPPAGGYYVTANDNVGDANTLTIEFANSTPVDASAYERELNGAIVNWTSAALAAVLLQPGLVVWWPGDGNTVDIQGGRDDTWAGTAAYAAGVV